MLDPYVFIHGYLFFFNSKPAKVSGKKRLYHVTFRIFSYCNILNNIRSLQILFTDDYNRVVLETMDREPDSDYVNASYIDVSSSYYIKDRTLIIYSTNIISNVPFWSRIGITANKCTYLLQYITFTQWSQQQIVPQNCYFFLNAHFERQPQTDRRREDGSIDWWYRYVPSKLEDEGGSSWHSVAYVQQWPTLLCLCVFILPWVQVQYLRGVRSLRITSQRIQFNWN